MPTDHAAAPGNAKIPDRVKLRLFDQTQARCITLVERCHNAFIELLDSLEQALAGQSTEMAAHYARQEQVIRSKASAMW
jgi:hypothetical protein